MRKRKKSNDDAMLLNNYLNRMVKKQLVKQLITHIHTST